MPLAPAPAPASAFARTHGSGPERVFASAQPWPLHDATRTRQREAAALAASAPHALMTSAGRAGARLTLALAPHARRVGVLVGPGNNGGDALVAALHLQRQGIAVRALTLADPARLPADAAQAWQQAQGAGLVMSADWAVLESADLLIDGLLGLGATRAPSGALGDAIAATNASGLPVLALDLPSGLAADTGCPLGAQAVRARWTLSLLTLKPGLFTAQGRDHAGEVWFDDLGVRLGNTSADGVGSSGSSGSSGSFESDRSADGTRGADDAKPITAWLGAAAHAPPQSLQHRHHGQHKGSFGDLFVVGGAPGMQGALQLAAHAALTAGAGRVYLSPLDAATMPATPELMSLPRAWLAGRERLQRASVVCGCGGGSAVREALPALLAHAGRLLLDADALNAIAADADLARALHARRAQGGGTVLTPHPLEAARLLGCRTQEVQADRLTAAQRLAEATAAVVVLKGSGSVVAAPGRAPWINASGNAALATPGSGDVLAGWIGGLWAQQGANEHDGWLAARTGVWLHGRAADLALARQPSHAWLPLRAGALADAMAAALDTPA